MTMLVCTSVALKPIFHRIKGVCYFLNLTNQLFILTVSFGIKYLQTKQDQRIICDCADQYKWIHFCLTQQNVKWAAISIPH